MSRVLSKEGLRIIAPFAFRVIINNTYYLNVNFFLKIYHEDGKIFSKGEDREFINLTLLIVFLLGIIIDISIVLSLFSH